MGAIVEFTGSPPAYAFGHPVPPKHRGEIVGQYRDLIEVSVTGRQGESQIIRALPDAVRVVQAI